MLFRKKIDRYCTYCQFAGKIDDETMVCQFCGIVPSDHRCRRFRYDPLRRIPGRPAAPKHTHDDADFRCNLCTSMADAPEGKCPSGAFSCIYKNSGQCYTIQID